MPKSTRQLLDRLALYATAWAPRPGRNGDGPLANLVVGGNEAAATDLSVGSPASRRATPCSARERGMTMLS